MNFLQVAMVIGATSLFVTTVALLIIRTMPSRDGIGWWVIAAIMQLIIYILGTVFFGGAETIVTTLIFYCLQMGSMQAVATGMMLFVGREGNISSRLITLLAAISLIVIAMMMGNKTLASYVFAIYLAVVAFCAAIKTWHSKEATFLLNLAAVFLFVNGLHWLDYPIMSSVDWFVPFGFLLGLALVLSLYFSFATVALLQFKQVTKDSEDKAIHAATHDSLTGAFNRSYLAPLFNKYKSKVESSKGTFIMLYLDLDGFKAINDTYGHKAGDVILVVVTKRLKNWLGSKGDVVRIGGDELVVMNSLRSDKGNDIIYGTSAAQSILKSIEEPIVDGKSVYNISASIGACYYSPEFSNMEAMLSEADRLMYRAKEAGKRRVHFGSMPDDEALVSPTKAPEDLPEMLGSGSVNYS